MVPRKQNKFVFLLALPLVGIFLLTHSLVESKEKFESPISKKEKRILDYKNAITETISYPETIKLFYKGKKDDYAVFYDWNGHEAYYRYRRNKFDHEAEEKIAPLLEGGAYEITGKFIGMLIHVKQGESKINPISKFIPESDKLSIEEKRNKENIPVFTLKSFRTLELDQLIY